MVPAIFKTFDLKRVPRDDVVEEVRKLEATYTIATSTNNEQVLTLSAIPKVGHSHPDTLPGWIEFDINLGSATADANRKTNMAITDAPKLGEAFRSLLAEVKTALSDATNEMNGAMTELKDTTAQAVGMVKQVKAETADLKSALGLSSNGGPPLV